MLLLPFCKNWTKSKTKYLIKLSKLFFKQHVNNQKLILLFIFRAQSLVDFCKYAFEVESYDKALFCLKYCREMDRDDVISAVAKVYENVDVGNVKVKTELDKFLK